MGRTFQFDCPLCQYRTRVSGGTDAGINCSIQTIICHDCRELFDVFTKVRRRPETTGVVRKQLGFMPDRLIPPPFLREGSMKAATIPLKNPGPARSFFWEQLKPVCPASARHRVEVWQDPGRCPRCGCYLEKTVFPFRLWE